MSLPTTTVPFDAARHTNFVFALWIGCWEDSPWAGTFPAHGAYAYHKIAIGHLIARGMRIDVAVNPDDHDQFLGFIAHEPGLLHFVAVKSLFRRQGVASNLMASANFDRAEPILCSFRTTDARHLGKLVHKPQLARRKAAYP